MSNSQRSDSITPSSGDKVKNRTSGATRPSSLPPIFVVGTSSTADGPYIGAGGGLPASSHSRSSEVMAPPQNTMPDRGILIPFAEHHQNISSGPHPSQPLAVDEEAEAETEARVRVEDSWRRAPTTAGDATSCTGSADERSLVPRYAATMPQSIAGRGGQLEPARSPATRAVALPRHGHVCPTCGRALDEDDLSESSDLDDDNAILYGVVGGGGGAKGGGGSGGRWGTRRPPFTRAHRSGRGGQARVVNTYPGITPAPAALLCDVGESSGTAARAAITTQADPSGRFIRSNSSSAAQHDGAVPVNSIAAASSVGQSRAGFERSDNASSASASLDGVMTRDGPRPRVTGLTPHYFRALALPGPPAVLAIGDTTAPASPMTVLSEETASEEHEDIAAYVSPTGRHPPRGGSYPLLGAAEANMLVPSAPAPYPPPVAQPTLQRPIPLSATTTTAAAASTSSTEVPSPPLASAPASADSYYGRYFVEMAKLGSGAFGGVYLCQHVMEGLSLGLFALKKIPVGDAVPYLQSVLREVRILEEVKRHPNVVEYNHSWVEAAQLADFGPPVRCLFILMEYATEGSLDAYMDRTGAPLSTVAVWYFFLSAVAGTAHLHSKGILHRDLKPQNLLLTASGDGRPPRVLVSDFGTAALLDDVSYDRTGGTGTLEYMAPELLERDAQVVTETYVNRHTKASDIWSLGMILYYLAFDATLPPVREDGTPDLRDLLDRGSVQRPPEMLELLRAMLQRDPSRRPACQDILRSTVVQTIIRAFNHPSRTEADIFEPMSAFRNAGGRERSYATAVDLEDTLANEEAGNGEGGDDVGEDRGMREMMKGFTQLLRGDVGGAQQAGTTPLPLESSSTASSPRNRRNGGSSRVELLSMTSTMPLDYLEKREQSAEQHPHQQQPPRLPWQRSGGDGYVGSAGAEMPPLFARYHSNDVRRNSIVPVLGGDSSPTRAQRVHTPRSSPSPPPPAPTATASIPSGPRVETAKRGRQSSFSYTSANSPPPERKRRVVTADAAVQTDPVTILDVPE